MIHGAKFIFLLSVAMIFAGCATSTVEKRRTEKLSSYANLPPEFQALVDKGQIKVGMPSDAVYIAWGAPAQVLSGENEQGATTTWLYQGTQLEEHRYWNYREVNSGNRVFLERYLDFDYQARAYVSAEIIFVNGLVKSWRTLARPPAR